MLGSAEGELSESIGEWPPAGAEPLAIDSLYEDVADLGIDYGPAFQGVKAAWRRGEELFAELELGEEQAAQAERFGIHPALFDAALHAGMLEGDAAGEARVPFAWSGVRLHGPGASKLRVALARSGDGNLGLTIADAAGEPVAAVDELASRPLAAEALAGAYKHRDSIFTLEWAEQSLPGTGEGEAEPAEPLQLAPDPGLAPDAAAQALCAEVLARLQEAIAAEEETRIAFLTQGAVAAAEGESPDPAAAAVWGLVRSAQAEHPGRLLLIDTDGSQASEEILSFALAGEMEPQLALREGTALAPRLARADGEDSEPAPLDPERTVLITGASGALGSLFARHLVEQGARRLLLSSRRGSEAPGALELAAELSELGAEVRIAACDVADRDRLAELLASIPAEHPLGAVFHAAGVLDDGVVESLTPERLESVMAPKARAAWNLHELTREAELSELVLFSSAAATFGNPGQGNYAAANAFLDALAQRRAAEGLPASSIAWGAWELEGGMAGQVAAADRARIARGGARAIAAAEGLELFDRARGLGFAVAAPLDPTALRARARSGELSPLYRGLVRAPARRPRSTAGSLAQLLAAAPEAEREGLAVTLVAEHVAAVLGHDSAAAIDPTVAFKDLGFDSLAAVELRNRLSAATGLRLPSTLVFDHPTADAVGAYVGGLVSAGDAAPDAARQLERIMEIVDAIDPEERARVVSHLQSRLATVASAHRGSAEEAPEVDLETASDEEIFKLIDDGELGA